MPYSSEQHKSGVRQQIANALAALTQAEIATRSRQAVVRLRTQRLWRSASGVLFYAPMSGELDVWPLLLEAISEGKRVFLPRFQAAQSAYGIGEVRNPGTDLKVGRFGIREPVAACLGVVVNELDLILVPGVAFDLHGRRLGRGKGYYDRLLGSVRGITCGVGFDEQIVSEVPVEPHDVRLNCILTPTRWIEL